MLVGLRSAYFFMSKIINNPCREDESKQNVGRMGKKLLIRLDGKSRTPPVSPSNSLVSVSDP